MSDAKLGTGFRFNKLVAWAPAIVLALAFILLVAREWVLGGAFVVFALLLWLLVARRKKEPTGTGTPADRPGV